MSEVTTYQPDQLQPFAPSDEAFAAPALDYEAINMPANAEYGADDTEVAQRVAEARRVADGDRHVVTQGSLEFEIDRANPNFPVQVEPEQNQPVAELYQESQAHQEAVAARSPEQAAPTEELIQGIGWNGQAVKSTRDLELRREDLAQAA